MSRDALTVTRAYLEENRTMILGHAIGAAFVGLVPLPYVDEYLPSVLRRRLIRQIAEARGVDLDDEAVRMIADGRVPKPTWRNLVGSAPLVALLRGGFRRALAAFTIYRRAEGASRTFALATLFDHYCARQHVGGALDLAGATELRRRLETTVKATMGSVPAFLVRRAFAGTLRIVARAPSGLLEAVRRRRLPPGEVEAEEMASEALEEAAERGVLGRAARVVEKQAALGAFVDELVAVFERTP